MLDPQAKALLEQVAAAGRPAIHTLPAPEARRVYRESRLPLQPDPPPVARTEDRVAELPTPRPRRARPLRAAHLLVVRNAAGEVLLEQRPARGVWGGLWCLPWLGPDDARPPAAERLASVRHAFTHFELEITPWALAADALDHGAGARRVWADAGHRATLGLPAPVRRLLDALESPA